MTFHVGQKVVCVKTCRLKVAILGKIYTVREVMLLSGWKTPGLLLAEISPTFPNVAFESLNFRPIVEKKTDISVFTEILDDENAKSRDKVTA